MCDTAHCQPPGPAGEPLGTGFLAELSHEVRSPLNAIIGFSELLLDETFGPLSKPQQEVVHDILTAGHHLQRLSSDVLDISKIRMGKMDLHLAVLSVRSVVEQTLSVARGMIPHKVISLAHSVPEDLAVTADERRLTQVLCNLFHNALLYCPNGAHIHVTAERDGEFVRLWVTDDGHGIPLDEQERVFEEFVSMDRGEHSGGTGLGLSVTRRLVELMGGEINLDSTPDEGCTFTFTLPAAERPSE